MNPSRSAAASAPAPKRMRLTTSTDHAGPPAALPFPSGPPAAAVPLSHGSDPLLLIASPLNASPLNGSPMKARAATVLAPAEAIRLSSAPAAASAIPAASPVAAAVLSQAASPCPVQAADRLQPQGPPLPPPAQPLPLLQPPGPACPRGLRSAAAVQPPTRSATPTSPRWLQPLGPALSDPRPQGHAPATTAPASTTEPRSAQSAQGQRLPAAGRPGDRIVPAPHRSLRHRHSGIRPAQCGAGRRAGGHQSPGACPER